MSAFRPTADQRRAAALRETLPEVWERAFSQNLDFAAKHTGKLLDEVDDVLRFAEQRADHAVEQVMRGGRR